MVVNTTYFGPLLSQQSAMFRDPGNSRLDYCGFIMGVNGAYVAYQS